MEQNRAPAAVSDGVSAGTMLRRAREAAGLHIAALAVLLKVPVRKLEALEEDRYDLMPDAVFARGLASSVCRALKIDAKPILDRLPQGSAPRLVRDTDGINAPFRAPSDAAPPGWIDYFRQPVFLVVFALLLGVLVLVLLPAARDDGDKPVQPAAITAPAANVPIQMPAPAPAPGAAQPALVTETVQAAAPAAAASAATPTVAGPTQAAPVDVAGVARVAAVGAATTPATTAPASPAASAATAAAASDGLVVIRAKGQTWVEVTDAKGAVALRKTLGAGESAAASGIVPLQVTVGRVDATEVQVRGKPFDLRPVSRDNVARFEVK